MPFDELSPDTDNVHDRENARALEIVAPGGNRIRKEPADVAVATGEPGRARRKKAVDLAALEQLGNGCPGPGILHAHIARQLDRNLLRPAGMLDPSPHPDDVRGLHAVLILQNDAGPDAGGELIFRQSDPLALEILRSLDAVSADINRVV